MSVAQVTLKAFWTDRAGPITTFQAIVTREKTTESGHTFPAVEWIVESLDEKVVRRALKRAGYPSTKTLVPVIDQRQKRVVDPESGILVDAPLED